jgi:hypothetical protein
MPNIQRMTKEERETYVDTLAKQLLELAEYEEEINDYTFLLGKYNSVYIGGNKYHLKLTRID